MARRIRWQIVVAVISALLVAGLLGQLALSTTAIAEPMPGGTYIEAVPGVPVQLIPLLNDPQEDPAGRDLGALLFDGLTRIGMDGLPESALARDWLIDASNEVYIFRLRDDVSWHDGEPFTADDVVFTLRALQDNDFGGDAALSNLWRNVQVDRIDAYTVRCTLNAPYAPFLSAARVSMLPEHLLGDVPVETWAVSEFARQPIGTGPYKLTELTAEHALLEANADYFIERPFIDRFEMRFIESAQAAVPVLADNQIDALGASTVAAPELSQVALPDSVRRINLRLDEYAVLTFNMRRSPLDEVLVRQALARGLDKDALLEQVLNGQVARIDTPILPGWLPFDPTVGWYAYEPEAAADGLNIAGYRPAPEGVRMRNGRPLRLPLITDNVPGRQAAAEELARQWGRLGIQIEIEQVDSGTLRQRLRDHDFVLAIHGWARLGPDPDVFELWHSSQAMNGLNYAGLRDDTIDELLEQGRIEHELAARNERYAAFQRRWVELVPSITLYQPLYTFAVGDNVAGLGFEQSDIASSVLLIGREDRYRNVTRWFVNSSREIRGTLR